MEILRATTTGMCFGVRDALKKVDQLHEPDAVTIYGQIVHNETVLVQLGSRGFRMVGEVERSNVPATPSVLITAHGISDAARSKLNAAGKQLIDTTCPLVTRVHQAAQQLQRDGYFVLVVGRPNHVEVRGIVEDLNAYEVIDREEAVRSYPFPRIGVVCQTTTPPSTVAAMRLAVVFRNPQADIRFHDTSCAPTRDNQRALDELLPQVDAMVVVGGLNSNNTRELVTKCESHGKPTIHVQDANGLQAKQLIGYEHIGLAAGTSTLDATLDEVHKRLQELASEKRRETGRRRTVWSSTEWLAYYRANLKRLLPIPWHLGACVTQGELAEIAPSLRSWQLGETSDGSHLIAAATRYATRVRDPLFVDVVKLFIAEEQRHGSDLGRFLDLAGVQRAKRDWGDSLFRKCRYALPSMEVWATPVVMVETHAMLYYDAIRQATGSPLLRRICTQILRDEVPHIRFQCERFAILHRRRSRIMRRIIRLGHYLFFTGISLAVWVGHRHAYRKGGYSFIRFWRLSWRRMRKAWRMMNPDHYDWPDAE